MVWESIDYAHEGSPVTIVTGNRAAVSFSDRGLGLADGTHVPDSATIGWRAHCSCGWEASEIVERVSDPMAPRRLDQVLDQDGGPALPETEDWCHEQWLDHLRQMSAEISVAVYDMGLSALG
ncbi:hypothetical protein [Rhodococcus qingshengii]|uniref:hypothetical protein n=1 Tax=Rhodococcus qingshengii TaxID=334542 RepID=UPI0007E59F38|nr:hypothetical protein [Rhodococcus qingshengii]QXC46470.1 hypothetical protein KSE96_29905 [Rhodococcus qingshengii]BCF86501.1 hypothetical protein RQCS_60460 [Rhodococcus qingshengii]